MKEIVALLGALLITGGCGSDPAKIDESVEKARESVKEVVTQDFQALQSARDTLKANADKTKNSLDAFDKESK
jgi:hypothetical protein